jgi:DNA-binding protein HU-beta
MNKAELIRAIAEGAGLSNGEAEKALDAMICSIERALKKGDKVSIKAWGTFSVGKRCARTGRNPKTAKPINIRPKKFAKFKAGSGLTRALDDKGPPG